MSKRVYIYHPETKAFLGPYDAQEDPKKYGDFICPIHSTDIEPPGNVKAGFYPKFTGSEWVVEEIPPPPEPVLTAEEIAAKEEAERLEALASEARQYSKLRALANMTPKEVQDYIDANVTTVAAARDAIKTLAVAVSVLARRL